MKEKEEEGTGGEGRDKKERAEKEGTKGEREGREREMSSQLKFLATPLISSVQFS